MDVFFQKVQKNLHIAPPIQVSNSKRKEIYRFVNENYDRYLDYIEQYENDFFDYSTFLNYLQFYHLNPPQEDLGLIFDIFDIMLEGEIFGGEDPAEMMELIFDEDDTLLEEIQSGELLREDDEDDDDDFSNSEAME